MTKKKLGPRKPGSGGARPGSGPKKGSGKKWGGDTLASPVRTPTRRHELVKQVAKQLGRTVPEVWAMIFDQFMQGGPPEQRALAAEAKWFQSQVLVRKFEAQLGKERDENRDLKKRNKEQAYELREERKRNRALAHQLAMAGYVDSLVNEPAVENVVARLRGLESAERDSRELSEKSRESS